MSTRSSTRRFLSLYRNPACITNDSPRARVAAGMSEYPGLIAWSLDVWRDDKGHLALSKEGYVPLLENGGLDWKVYGNVRVTMTLLTDKEPFVRHYNDYASV